MARYLVEHKHRAADCPTADPEAVRSLADHMEPESAARHGLTLVGECVIPGEHHLIAIIETDSPEKVAGYFTPFLQVGSVHIRPVKTCRNVADEGAD
jgi:hypothetical protein